MEVLQWVSYHKYKELSEFFLNLLDVPKAFTSRRYIWNWIRGKDFYKTISLITINLAKDFLQNGTEENLVKIERFIRIGIGTQEFRLEHHQERTDSDRRYHSVHECRTDRKHRPIG